MNMVSANALSKKSLTTKNQKMSLEDKSLHYLLALDQLTFASQQTAEISKRRELLAEIKECQAAIDEMPAMKGGWHEKHLQWLLKGNNLTEMDIDEIMLIIEVSRLEIRMIRAATII